jgi:predicted P-loop ATPase
MSINTVSQLKLTQNLKVATIMKATGRTDSEIATYCGISTKDFLEILENDNYLKEVFDNASSKVATEIEQKFLEKVLSKLDEGDTTDAKFFLERTTNKYSRKDNIAVTGELTIDEIIRKQDGKGEK